MKKNDFIIVVVGIVAILLLLVGTYFEVNAQPTREELSEGIKEYEVSLPPTVTDKREKHAYLLRAKELVRQEYNDMGARYNAQEITWEELQTYRIQEFEPKRQSLTKPTWDLQKEIEEDATLNIKIEDVIKEKSPTPIL